MKKKATKALEKTITHWEENLERAKAGEPLLTGIGNCPLCQVYRERECIGCPIRARTGQHRCLGTPYGSVIRADLGFVGDIVECTQRMVDFLKSLREEKVKKQPPDLTAGEFNRREC